MTIPFYKYQGTGNDFIIVDNRTNVFDAARADLVKKFCDRKFGIGSDGLLLLQNKTGYDFEAVFFNPDASMSLCGNGSRCIVSFAQTLGVIKDKARFLAIDGTHEAIINKDGTVSLKMNDVKNIETGKDHFFLDTGSPHYCLLVNDVKHYNVVEEGRRIRNSDRFRKEGTNVNFLEKNNSAVYVRTYERGVENETLSCGTGVTASALAAALKGIATAGNYCDIKTPGGNLRVKFQKNNDGSFSGIWLEGPAEFVFKGEITI